VVWLALASLLQYDAGMTTSTTVRSRPRVPETLCEALDRWDPGKVSRSPKPKGLGYMQPDESCLVVVRYLPRWIVGYRLVNTPGVVGGWSMTDMALRHLGDETVTVADWHSFPFGKLLAVARQLAGLASKGPSADLRGKDRVRRERLAAFLEDRRGGPPRTDLDHAYLAREYATLMKEGVTTPAKELAERYGHGTSATWANRLMETRSRGLLTKATTGGGGVLTPRARSLLGMKDADNRPPTPRRTTPARREREAAGPASSE